MGGSRRREVGFHRAAVGSVTVGRALKRRPLLDLLNLPPETHFIVGHNPLWNDGNTTGLWLNVIGIKNHHIIVSSSGSRAPYFTLAAGKLFYKFAVDIEPEVYNYG